MLNAAGKASPDIFTRKRVMLANEHNTRELVSRLMEGVYRGDRENSYRLPGTINKRWYETRELADKECGS